MEHPVRVRASLLWHLVGPQRLAAHPVGVGAQDPEPDHLEERARQRPRFDDPLCPLRARPEVEPRDLLVVNRTMAAARRRIDVGQPPAVPLAAAIPYTRPHSSTPAIGRFLPCLTQKGLLLRKGIQNRQRTALYKTILKHKTIYRKEWRLRHEQTLRRFLL